MYSWIVGLLIIVVCGLLSVLQWRTGRHLRHLPSFSYLPFLGNAHHILGDSKKFLKKLTEVSMKIDETNLPFIIWMGPHPVFVINDLEDAKLVSNAFVDKPYFYNYIQVWLGDGIGTAPGNIWKKRVKKLGGIFSQEVVNSYQETFNTMAKKLVKLLKSKVDKEPFNISVDLAHVTFDSICELALGIPDASTIVSVEEYCNAVVNTLKETMWRSLNVHIHPDFIYKRTSSYNKLNGYVAFLYGVAEIMINEHMQRRSKQEIDNFSENSQFRQKSYMETLLDMNLSQHELMIEVNTILFAGGEPVAAELFFIFMNIARRKDVQEKLYNEMKEIFGDSKRDVGKEDLDRMVYCDAVINETLRLYPVTPMATFRRVDHDLKIKSCTIPKGASCILSAWGSGRSKRLWGPDALEFNPDRWSDPANSTTNLMTFSIGKRPCIGKKYALRFLKIALAHCIRELVFTSDNEALDLRLDIVLTAAKGNLIQVKLREEN